MAQPRVIAFHHNLAYLSICDWRNKINNNQMKPQIYFPEKYKLIPPSTVIPGMG
ncbi:hypothetical protein EZS27_002097 [termite gut metagenome]|uniref:Uncharacterized protein n=1 Tax=termite gut metagenome TaxID=433724 RepID=A0A5J4SZ35_9ZZZZ